MSNLYDYKNPWFNINNFHEPEPPEPHMVDVILKHPIRIIFGFAALIIFCSICKLIKMKCCKNEPSGANFEYIYTNNYNHQIPRSMPVTTTISENSRHLSSSTNTSNPLALRPPTTFTPSAPDASYFPPQTFQPTAPRLIENNTPKDDNPPNYDEAMTMMSQEKHGLESPQN